MVVGMMPIIVVSLSRPFVSSVVTRVAAFMVVMIVGMERQCRNFVADMPINAYRRRPSELERNDKHDDQGDKATHNWHSTEFTEFTIACSYLVWHI